MGQVMTYMQLFLWAEVSYHQNVYIPGIKDGIKDVKGLMPHLYGPAHYLRYMLPNGKPRTMSKTVCICMQADYLKACTRTCYLSHLHIENVVSLIRSKFVLPSGKCTHFQNKFLSNTVQDEILFLSYKKQDFIKKLTCHSFAKQLDALYYS